MHVYICLDWLFLYIHLMLNGNGCQLILTQGAPLDIETKSNEGLSKELLNSRAMESLESNAHPEVVMRPQRQEENAKNK